MEKVGRGRTKKHGHCSGGKNSRLYTCWLGMKRRTNKYNREVYKTWESFEEFKIWSLSNGYDDEKVLCRNLDMGGYSPTNARWDTVESNRNDERLSKRKTYKNFLKDGEPVEFTGLLNFCKENSLNPSHMRAVATGKRQSHKGFTRRDV